MAAATSRGSGAAKTFVHDLLLAALSLLEPTCRDDPALQKTAVKMCGTTACTMSYMHYIQKFDTPDIAKTIRMVNEKYSDFEYWRRRRDICLAVLSSRCVCVIL